METVRFWLENMAYKFATEKLVCSDTGNTERWKGTLVLGH